MFEDPCLPCPSFRCNFLLTRESGCRIVTRQPYRRVSSLNDATLEYQESYPVLNPTPDLTCKRRQRRPNPWISQISRNQQTKSEPTTSQPYCMRRHLRHRSRVSVQHRNKARTAANSISTHLPILSIAKAATSSPGNSARLLTKTSLYTWSEPSAPAAAAAAAPPPHSPPPASCT